ncbi:MAG TPA: RAD55 family ATPase [Candidatus Thermoplasmatota archaeon]|jgi:KaiC/GvpD/RAD55 family RecA-like ATPase|nr:RAD55 family ATPase [Candidatus Thermoplasmatota archaeon]
MKLATGVKRLDELLEGGVPAQSCTLLVGPPFLGKEVLARLFLLAGLRAGQPAVMVCTDATAAEATGFLEAIEPRTVEWVQRGLLRFVDTYSRTIGADDHHPTAELVDGTLDLNALSGAVNAAQQQLLPHGPQHRLVFDSLSTLLAYTNPPTAFRFLQVFLGRARRAGATTMLQLEAGMHAEADVQMLKHLAHGVIEVRSEAGKPLLRVEGLGVTESRGWVEYRFGERNVELIGSFAAGRIR